MWKHFSAFVGALLISSACPAADLTPTETRWLNGAWPVLTYAKQAGLPLDIIVQPQPTPGVAPLALAFLGGRCKLVLSLRGNPEGLATLERIEPDLLDATLELMAAHELGHCRRHLDGAWHGLPAGFSANAPDGLSPELRAAQGDMSAARREEGYADLVGMAWTRRHHPQQYASLQAWLVSERSRDLVYGSQHDTLAWVRLAQPGSALDDGSIFEASAALWLDGLSADD